MSSPWPFLNSSPAQLVNSTVSPSLTVSGVRVPSLLSLPGPTARTLPFCGLFLGAVRQKDAAGGLLVGLETPDHYPVAQRFDVHARLPSKE